MTYLKLNNRVVGSLNEDTYITYRNTKKHFFIKFRGYGISTSVLDYLKEHGIVKIRIIEERVSGERRNINSTITDWEEKGIEYKASEYDKQIILPIK